LRNRGGGNGRLLGGNGFGDGCLRRGDHDSRLRVLSVELSNASARNNLDDSGVCICKRELLLKRVPNLGPTPLCARVERIRLRLERNKLVEQDLIENVGRRWRPFHKVGGLRRCQKGDPNQE
jgi:hypothetical protein